MAAGFDLISRLGSGYFGDVWLVVDTGLNVQRAVKFIPPNKILDERNFFSEAQILKVVEHANIVKVEDTGILDDKRLYITMEYLAKGSLEDESKGGYVHLTRVKRVMIDALRGLGHAHFQDLLHRDIKPANILIGNNNEGKLSDFGLAAPIGTDFNSSRLGNYAYVLHMAPEVIRYNRYSILSDIYACGVTLYRLVNGDSYLPPIGTIDARRNVIQGTFPDRQHYREFVPRNLRVLINRAMNVDPAKRYQSADRMRHSLEQVIIQKNWDETTVPEGIQWVCSWNGTCFEVTRKRAAARRWDVVVKRGPSRRRLRRIVRLCKYGLTKSEGLKITKSILQKFVMGKLP